MALPGRKFRFRWLIVVTDKLINFFEKQLSLKRQEKVQMQLTLVYESHRVCRLQK